MTEGQRKELQEARQLIAQGLEKLDRVLQTPPPPATPTVSVPPVKSSRKIAICVGHSRKGDAGASSVGCVSEWEYNQPIAKALVDTLKAAGHDARLYDTYGGASYTSAVNWLADKLKSDGAEFAVELHFNAAGPTAAGYEYLYWHASAAGKNLAQAFLDAHRKALPQFQNRGIKLRTASDRGAFYLQRMPCPAIILEPFFGSNPDEWKFYGSNPAALQGVYQQAIFAYVATLP